MGGCSTWKAISCSCHEKWLACSQRHSQRRSPREGARGSLEPYVRSNLLHSAKPDSIFYISDSGYKLMKLLPNFMANRPQVAEFDFSGIVVDTNGTRFSTGDSVYGWLGNGLFWKYCVFLVHPKFQVYSPKVAKEHSQNTSRFLKILSYPDPQILPQCKPQAFLSLLWRLIMLLSTSRMCSPNKLYLLTVAAVLWEHTQSRLPKPKVRRLSLPRQARTKSLFAEWALTKWVFHHCIDRVSFLIHSPSLLIIPKYHW